MVNRSRTQTRTTTLFWRKVPTMAGGIISPEFVLSTRRCLWHAKRSTRLMAELVRKWRALRWHDPLVAHMAACAHVRCVCPIVFCASSATSRGHEWIKEEMRSGRRNRPFGDLSEWADGIDLPPVISALLQQRLHVDTNQWWNRPFAFARST
jgi:hypothetical protein